MKSNTINKVINYNIIHYKCSTPELIKQKSITSKLNAEKRNADKITEYYKNPSVCLCGKDKPFEQRNNKYCSASCAGTFFNKKLTKESRIKQGLSLSKTFSNAPIKHNSRKYFKSLIAGPFSKIHLCTCKYSGLKWYSPRVKTIHPNLAISKNRYRYSSDFKFALSDYYEWFKDEFELIKLYGWYSTPGSKKNGKINVNGISRDHLYSVTDGWLNNIDPSIIRHPANCQLIRHKDNQRKNSNSKSNITIEELHSRIKLFESIYN